MCPMTSEQRQLLRSAKNFVASLPSDVLAPQVRGAVGAGTLLPGQNQRDVRASDLGQQSKATSMAGLHPWSVISSVLGGLQSDEVVRVIDRAGLKVNWTLTAAQSYSHLTRKRAYLPRIQAAYEELPDEEELVVASIVASTLAGKGENYAAELNSALSKIGWKLESGELTTDSVSVREQFFPKGTEHDAYLQIRDILRKAHSVVVIIDPYMDSSMFQMLAAIPVARLKVQLLSSKLPTDFALEARKFQIQYPHLSLEIRKTREFHDRFILLDGVECYHIGASIKDAGNRAFMISQIGDQTTRQALMKCQDQSWSSASPVAF